MAWVKRDQQRCKTCAAYVADSANAVQGTCRFNPPTMLQGVAPNPKALLDPKQPAMLQTLQTFWPPVHKDGWCYKWDAIMEGNV